jgi:hypothetical protein
MTTPATRLLVLTLILTGFPPPALSSADETARFREHVAPLLSSRCVRCHRGKDPKGDVDLTRASRVVEGQGDGWIVVPGKPEESLLLEVVAGPKPTMPKSGDPLGAAEVAALRAWIAGGAPWPKDVVLKDDPRGWWSFRPLTRPGLPPLGPDDRARVRTPVDAFILAGLRSRGLKPSPEADRRTLIRRVHYDLVGLPPSPEEVEAFLVDRRPDAYERVVDRLLASPHHGERWGRHWLDVVHYGETHGYDKDRPRPNAWPYRDYVVRAFNEDRPYGQFVREQLAGDVLYPGTRDGIEALGFLAAGPWDAIGHMEVPETKVDGQIARLLDRDDMVASTLNTFNSLTAQCARCHDHKFDPVTQEDYYSLQAVFAALDRADRPYDLDPAAQRRRSELTVRRLALIAEDAGLRRAAEAAAGAPLVALDRKIAEAEAARVAGSVRHPAFGYHSRLHPSADATKWVQVDLGAPVAIDRVILHACDDDNNMIGEGFGFPSRFRVELSDEPGFEGGAVVLVDRTAEDVPNPRLAPVRLDAAGRTARYVRVTATKLARRGDVYIFALAELEVLDAKGEDLARGARVTALDATTAPPRWRPENLTDGIYPAPRPPDELPELRRRREALVRESLGRGERSRLDAIRSQLRGVEEQVAALPPASLVYCGTIHDGRGSFRGTGADGGVPRTIRVLRRGDVRDPMQVVGPGTVAILDGAPCRFDLPPEAPEGERRAALARWITDLRHPLTWRSIVNRVWLYHFGRGIVDSPNDFGRMGQQPSHPELLDWLAAEFRDGGQSLKALHRLIVTSATYRQSSASEAASATVDAGNVSLWRMNRRRLEAEEIRDGVLTVAGRLDLRLGGPSYQDFVIEQPQNSPHYQYHLFDPDDSRSHRRSIYRFIVRSQPQPFLTTLDCADPSMSVEKRNESLTALQALALLNNRFMLVMASRFGERLEQDAGDLQSRVERAYRLALGRPPTAEERTAMMAFAGRFGLANMCRAVFNLNEFLFVD